MNAPDEEDQAVFLADGIRGDGAEQHEERPEEEHRRREPRLGRRQRREHEQQQRRGVIGPGGQPLNGRPAGGAAAPGEEVDQTTNSATNARTDAPGVRPS